jgi:hypothetical protein
MIFGVIGLVLLAAIAIVLAWLWAGKGTGDSVIPGYLVVAPGKKLVLEAGDVRTLLSEAHYRDIIRQGTGMFVITSNEVASLSMRPQPRIFSLGEISLSSAVRRRYERILIIQDEFVRDRFYALAVKLREEHIARTSDPRLRRSATDRGDYIITGL